MSRVYIILLNWNNWPDTLECLESLFQLEYQDFKVIVCDNGSTDGSIERIRSWAADDLDILVNRSSPRSNLKPCSKPVALAEYDRETAEKNCIEWPGAARLTLLCNGSNLGFAGGNNVGLRYALGSSEFNFCWVLNNDTVVAPDSLQTLVDRMSAQDKPGLCGSTLLEYDRPGLINALGGAVYSRYLGLAWHLGRGRSWPRDIAAGKVEKQMDYVVGASMFVSRDFLQQVGLLEESYFLYYEELDWALRAHHLFPLAWASDSVVYHKVGGTIGTSSHPARKSWTSDFYTLRNRIRFTRKHCPYALPTVYLGLFGAVALRLLFGQWRRAVMVAKLIVNPEISFEDCCDP